MSSTAVIWKDKDTCFNSGSTFRPFYSNMSQLSLILYFLIYFWAVPIVNGFSRLLVIIPVLYLKLHATRPISNLQKLFLMVNSLKITNRTTIYQGQMHLSEPELFADDKLPWGSLSIVFLIQYHPRCHLRIGKLMHVQERSPCNRRQDGDQSD